MPGLVIGSRRWAIGSDDFIIPGSILILLHIFWLIVYSFEAITNGTPFPSGKCSDQILYHFFGSFVMIFGELIVEFCIIRISLKGTILNSTPRKGIQPLLIIRILFFLIELLWEAYGVIIVLHSGISCENTFRELVIFLKILSGFTIFIFGFSIWCSYDPAGRSWVKMKRFQESLRNPKLHYKRSQSQHRNWRYREAMREYEQSWQNRCRNFFCLLTFKSPRDNSFGNIAKLLSEFFRGLDVVPSDVVAGLSLMRAKQKVLFKEQLNHYDSLDNVPDISTNMNGQIFEFLSGVPITTKTDFLDLMHPLVIQEVQNLIHYFHYSLAIYGWPMYLVNNSPKKWCKLCQFFSCFCCCTTSRYCNAACCFHSCCCSRSRANPMNFERHFEVDTIVDNPADLDNSELFVGDNCCHCNRAAIQETCIEHNYKIVYMNYEVEIEKPPFFVAVDFDKMSIVISIRGTLSLYDVLTDLNAENDHLPVDPPNEEFYGHKGMIAAASHILSKLKEKHIIKRAIKELKAQDRGRGSYQNHLSLQYPIIIVGHSLGAGTAAILAILLKQTYSNVMCFAFAPPGGLLSSKAAEYSQEFVVSIVHGKDCVPRLGLYQMEKMRFDLIMAIKQCNLPKWSIITQSCCWLRKSQRNDISMKSFIEKFQMDNCQLNAEPDNDDEDPHDQNDNVACSPIKNKNIAYDNNQQSNVQANNQNSIKLLSSTSSESRRNERRHSKTVNKNSNSNSQHLSVHPNDESISLSVHTPLFPPGSIIHLVRSHPEDGLKGRSKWSYFVNSPETIVQAVWTTYKDYNEILISPTMVRDHMPDQMLKAMNRLLESSSLRRPFKREWTEQEKAEGSSGRSSSTQSNTPSHCQHVETSFANVYDQTTNDLEQRFTNLNEDRLRRLRSLVKKGRAPLAEDENWSLEDASTEQNVSIFTDTANGDEKALHLERDRFMSTQAHPTSIIIDLTTNGPESREHGLLA